MDHEEDYEASYAMALKATESVFVHKELEVVGIANPDNGSDFFRLCISFPIWGERGCKMTTFRMCGKCRLLGLLASDDAALKEAGIPSNEKPFSQWLRMHVYWWQLESGVITLANKLQLENDAVRKLHLEAARESGQSIAAALQFYRAHHFNKAFLCWKANIKATNDATEQSHFGCTVRRLLYRWWLGYILKVSRFPILEHPSNAWVDLEREETGIYPKDWIDDLQGTDAWQDFPWFLDYADGVYPDVEEGAYHGENYVCISFTWMVAINQTYIGFFAAHHKKVKGKGKSSSATIIKPKDAHSPSTAKGWPPRTAKGRPSTSKKRPRPVVSESFESLEEQFELLNRENAKDSRHADSDQHADSRRSSPSGRSRSQGSRQSSPSQKSRSQGSRWSSLARGLRSRHSQARTSDTARSHPSGADLDDSKATQIKPIHLAVLCNSDNIRRAICNRRAPQVGLQDICKLLGSLSYTGQMDPNARLGGVRLMWADLPAHCKVDVGFGGVPLWNVFTDGIVLSVFTNAAEFLFDDGTLVVACRAEHLFKVISEACEFQFCHIRTLFLRMPLHTYVMDYDFTDQVANLIVAMFVRDLDGPLPVPFYDRRAGDIAVDIDGYEADSDML
ncbi:hypothetical protein L7F22_064841 [Adiantum nelumboides]|nr:hypothetical protein [Adiantum nelumboides]